MSTPPITNPAGHELVERDSFQNEAIWLPAMGVQHLNAGKFMIEGKTFTDCLIEGPAVLGVGDGVQFDGCNMGSATDVRTLLLTPRGSKAAGVIGFKDCRFLRCRFTQIGFTGPEDAVAEMERGLLSAREITDKAAQAELKAKAEAEGKAS
ncbi:MULTISPECIES: hypothetical protein [unclassified Brevundimonas]|jgi:hypothetical protein|uniref:hypothetical protein n=1 Tax=unclassified Brevundimonas TaxID=2622653 RepID=UPI000C3F1AB5|nr:MULTISPECIES: hypothetical protein [unclassified Brevundimonas]MAL89557.1 hypothetical protein [Brevundimonas sp.]HAJ02844.1 hypothetical protein [Brevundimonas sp.]HAV50047.1 hypothetical protein [Brevundimonas sp.]|tara:strand:- start:3266 stop:3718 length:453 start_codon:yes stop_codon:yes gene_type:complete